MKEALILIMAVLMFAGCSVDNRIKGSYVGDDDTSVVPEPSEPGSDPSNPEEGRNGDFSFKITNPGEDVPKKTFSVIQIELEDPVDHVASAEFYIDEGLRCEVFEAPFECRWRVPAADSMKYLVTVYINTIDGETYQREVLVASY